MSRPVGWGLVGCGWIAADYVVPALGQLRSRGVATTVAVFDLDPARAGALAELCGAELASSVEELVDHPGVDAVYVATPNHAHRAPALAAAAAGRAVLVEKPLAADLVDAEDIVRGSAGVLAATAFDQRWHSAHRTLAALLADGAIGTVTAVRIVYACWLPPAWSASPQSPADNWRVDPARAGGGAGIDLAPHAVDLVGCLLGDDLVTLTALSATRVHDYPVDDGTVLIGRTGQGVLASIHVSYATPDVLPRRRIEVIGTSGQLTAIDTMGQTPGGSVTLTSAVDGGQTPVDFDAVGSPFTAQLAAFSAAVAGDTWPYPIERDLRLHELLLGALTDGAPTREGANR